MPRNIQATFDFLTDLRFNNNKSWFEENRKRYDQARGNAEALVADIIQHFAPVEDLGKVTPKECFFRINRDVRFSKDKSPYKTEMGIVIGPQGRKSTGNWYYLHIAPGDSFIGGGLYDPTPEQLKTIRETIAQKPKVLEKILAAPDFVRYFKVMEGEKLKTPPKGYSADHSAIELLKHKQFLASHPFSDDDLLSEGFTAHFITLCQALKPFGAYFHDMLKS